MDRGAWRATVHEVARVRHDLATKPPLPGKKQKVSKIKIYLVHILTQNRPNVTDQGIYCFSHKS